MNISLFRKILALIAVIMSLALLFCACDGAEGKESDTEKTTVTEAPTQTETETETQTETEAGPKMVTYTIKVVDESGAPVAGATVQLCQGDLCLPPMPSDANGVAVFEAFEAEYTAKVFATGYTSDEDGYSFEDGSYELTVEVSKTE
ncbi:MAG: carboxypeptidase regulatory-like domain-containing protein [Clostridia bacterium]|nr:carboxypeptidase regulatory-like domain-containing protein [Clostridia bacterium]